MRKFVCLLLLVPMLAGCSFLRSHVPELAGRQQLGSSASPQTAETRTADGAAAGATRPAGATPSARETPAPVSTADSQEILDAFAEIAFTSEYPAGGAPVAEEIRKWTAPIRVAVHGDPTADDEAALRRAMDGLNSAEGFPGIGIAEEGANLDLWFVPLDRMGDVIPGYVEDNWGFFMVHYSDGVISSANVAIASDVTDQRARNHLILEEVLQSTGLMQDSYTREDSIFYGRWTTVQQPTDLDWALLRLLYLPELKPGTPKDEAMESLGEWIEKGDMPISKGEGGADDE